jgi:hypothetical protein
VNTPKIRILSQFNGNSVLGEIICWTTRSIREEKGVKNEVTRGVCKEEEGGCPLSSREFWGFGSPGELTNSLPSPVTDRFVKYKGDFNCSGEGLKVGLFTTGISLGISFGIPLWSSLFIRLSNRSLWSCSILIYLSSLSFSFSSCSCLSFGVNPFLDIHRGHKIFNLILIAYLFYVFYFYLI